MLPPSRLPVTSGFHLGSCPGEAPAQRENGGWLDLHCLATSSYPCWPRRDVERVVCCSNAFWFCSCFQLPSCKEHFVRTLLCLIAVPACQHPIFKPFQSSYSPVAPDHPSLASKPFYFVYWNLCSGTNRFYNTFSLFTKHPSHIRVATKFDGSLTVWFPRLSSKYRWFLFPHSSVL